MRSAATRIDTIQPGRPAPPGTPHGEAEHGGREGAESRPVAAPVSIEVIEGAIAQVLGDAAGLALQCADMVTEIVARFAMEVDRPRLRGVGREICYRELVHRKVPFHPRKLSEALLSGFSIALPTLEPRTVATMILRRLSMPPFAPAPRAAPTAVRPFARPGDASGGTRVGNAGLVLLGPYLPRLFSMLDLLEGGAFRGDPERTIAVHVLFRLAKGREAPEGWDFGLERVLCGTAPDWMPMDGIRPDEKAAELCEQLLGGVVQNWKALGSTSPRGLRETFLDRTGTLGSREDGWHLEVVPGPFDMLIDRLPWGYTMIRHPWMENPLQTKWRDA